MDDIGRYLKEMDLRIVLFILIGYAIYIFGRYYSSNYTANKNVIFLIKVIPVLLSLTIIISGMINKIHHQSFEGTLLIVLLFVSVFSFFPKLNDL